MRGEWVKGANRFGRCDSSFNSRSHFEGSGLRHERYDLRWPRGSIRSTGNIAFSPFRPANLRWSVVIEVIGTIISVLVVGGQGGGGNGNRCSMVILMIVVALVVVVAFRSGE